MKTLLQPGDKIRIRSDIKEQVRYKMKTSDHGDTFLLNSSEIQTIKPGQMVTIKRIRHGKYVLEEEGFFNYTDEMFEPDVIEFLYEEYLNNK